MGGKENSFWTEWFCLCNQIPKCSMHLLPTYNSQPISSDLLPNYSQPSSYLLLTYSQSTPILDPTHSWPTPYNFPFCSTYLLPLNPSLLRAYFQHIPNLLRAYFQLIPNLLRAYIQRIPNLLRAYSPQTEVKSVFLNPISVCLPMHQLQTFLKEIFSLQEIFSIARNLLSARNLLFSRNLLISRNLSSINLL